MNDIVRELPIKSSYGYFDLDIEAQKQIVLTGMQPYFFPYIGYFQLLECGDVFVVGDDFQYIKGGWVNRNRILMNREPFWLIFPVQGGSSGLHINQRFYVGGQYERDKILLRIESAYRKAPYFKNVYPIIDEIMRFGSNNVSDFNTNSIRRLSEFMEIKCKILVSSELNKDNSLRCEHRAIEINRCLRSSHFVNPLGGSSLYQETNFIDCGIELSFLRSGDVRYHQFSESFTPSLSIIDVLMFCSLDEVKCFLKQYHLLKQSDIN